MRRTLLGTACTICCVAGVAVTVPQLASGASAARAKPVYVDCFPTNSRSLKPLFLARQHPKSCNIQAEPEDVADLIQLRSAKWSGWGRATTTATGRALNNNPGMGGPKSFAIKLRLSRIRSGCHGRRQYTRVTVLAPRKSSPLKLTTNCRANFA